MKLVPWTIAIGLALLFASCREPADEPTAHSVIDRNRVDLARAVLQLEGVEFSEEELLAFDQSARVTQAILTAAEAPPLIQILRPNEASDNVPYTEIESLIRKGDVVQAGQDHSNHVEIITRDGRRLASTQPKIDAIIDLCREVDPKMVFIDLWTE